jgi:hypothetical protein
MKIWIRQTSDFVKTATDRVGRANRAYSLAIGVALLSIFAALFDLVFVGIATTAAVEAIPALGLNETAAQDLADTTSDWGGCLTILFGGVAAFVMIGIVALLVGVKQIDELATATEPLRYIDPATVVRVALPEGETP